MPNEIELRECPFCGSPAGAYSRPPVYGGYTFRCNNTDCPIDAETGLFDSEAAAAEAWNHRAPAPAREGETPWIPTERELPEPYTQLIVTRSDGIVVSAYYSGKWFDDDNNLYLEQAPLAWQPLPEPYQVNT